MGNRANEKLVGLENGVDIFRNEYGDYVKLEGDDNTNQASILDSLTEDADVETMLQTLEKEWQHMEAKAKALEKENADLVKKLANREKELAAFTENNITVKKFKTLENVKYKLEKQIEELKAENKTLSMKRKAKTAREREDELLREIDQLKEDNLILEDYLEHSVDEADKLRSELKQVREGYSKLYRSKEEQSAEYKNIAEWNEMLSQELGKLDSFIKRKGLASVMEQECYRNIREWTEFLQQELEKLHDEDAELALEKEQLKELQCTPKRLEKLLRSKKILIMGGHVNWQNRIKEVYPKLAYMDSDNVNFDVSVLKTADYIFFNTLHCSHTLYFKVKENICAGRDKQDAKDKLVYINNNNVDVFTDILMEKLLGEL